MSTPQLYGFSREKSGISREFRSKYVLPSGAPRIVAGAAHTFRQRTWLISTLHPHGLPSHIPPHG